MIKKNTAAGRNLNYIDICYIILGNGMIKNYRIILYFLHDDNRFKK